MQHLTTLDAGFLEAEDSDRHVSLAIGGLAVMEGPAPDHASLGLGARRAGVRDSSVHAGGAHACARPRGTGMGR